MKIVLYVVLLILTMCASAAANDEPVPGHTLLTRLPEGSRLVVKQDMWDGKRIKKTSLSSDFTTASGNTVRAGDVLPITHHEITSNGSFLLYFDNGRERGNLYFSLDEPKNVDEFNAWSGDFFQIVYDDPAHYDPYPGMDKSVVVDVIMMKITTALKEKKYSNTLRDFALLEKQGIPLPESFYFYYTDALEKTGKKGEAHAHATDYLKRYGKKGKYYAQIVEILSKL